VRFSCAASQELRINVPGDDFVVKKQCKTFEEAVELAAESLEDVGKGKKNKNTYIM
jgi:putative sigma-54 modulation protein